MSAEATVHSAGVLKYLRGTTGKSIDRWPVNHEVTVIIAIQPPYLESLQYFSEPGKTGELDPYYLNIYVTFDLFAVGGLQDLDTVQDRIDALEAIRMFLGNSVHIHAFVPERNLR